MHSHTCTLVGVARPRRDLSLLSWVLATQVFFLFSSLQFNILPLMICRLRLNLPPWWVGWVGWNDLESLHTVVLYDPFFGFPHGPTLCHVQMGFPSPLTLRTLFLRVGGESRPYYIAPSSTGLLSKGRQSLGQSLFFFTLGSFVIRVLLTRFRHVFAGIFRQVFAISPFGLIFFPASRNLELLASRLSMVDNPTH